MNKSVLLVIVILCSLKINAQTSFVPGYVITGNNDTIAGSIHFSGNSINEKCEFKDKASTVARQYSPGEIKGFRIQGSKFYISRSVAINGAKRELFLEFLVNGTADLFSARDNDHTYFFIQKSGGLIQELTEKNYTETLKLTFSDSPRLFTVIDETEFKSLPLIDVTKKYNKAVSSEKVVFYVKPPAITITFGGYLAANKTALNFENSILYEAFVFDQKPYPSFGIISDISFPRFNRAVSFELSGEIGKGHFYASNLHPLNSAYFEELNLYILSFKGKGGFKFTIPKGKIRPTLSLGGNLLYVLKNDARRIEDNVEDPIVYMNKSREDITAPNQMGFYADLGLDFCHSSSFKPFVRIGYSTLTGENKGSDTRTFITTGEKAIATNYKTISISAGIYF